MKDRETHSINSMCRLCRNCAFWEKMPVGEHTGYCRMIGKDVNLRIGYENTTRSVRTMKAKTTDYSLCDLHVFMDRQSGAVYHNSQGDNNRPATKKGLFNLKYKR